MSINARQDMIKVVSIEFKSDVDNRVYKGNFTIKKLSIRDLAALGVRKSQLNGGMYYNADTPGRGVDEETDNFNSMIAQLELAIKESPEWWNLDEITDPKLIGVVYKEVLSFENSFLRRKLEGEKSGGTSASGSTKNISETNSGGNVSQVVGQEVSAALEP